MQGVAGSSPVESTELYKEVMSLNLVGSAMLSIGIVGLPNVGKSTLFNALIGAKQAQAQNYPFCTIEPNVGIVAVPDERLEKLADVSRSEKTIPTAIQFVDIAGLVKGASEGEGLGNKFLSHIREVDAIIHVVRDFEDKNITHVHGAVDPAHDAEIINLELVIADTETASRRLEKIKKQAKGSALKEVQKDIDLLERLLRHLGAGRAARDFDMSDDEREIVQDLHLLSAKPMLYAVNTSEVGAGEYGISLDAPFVAVCARLESEIAELPPEEASEYLQSLGMSKSGLDTIIVAGYQLLDLITFFTSGIQETRAWTIRRGTKGPQAAGVIHTDFVAGYIKADVAAWQDFVDCGGWGGVKEAGNVYLAGKDYTVKDGDVCYFHVST